LCEEVYKEDNFVVLRDRKCYIVINEDKEFKEGHSHLKSLWACKKVIHCAKLRTINGDMNNYMLTSIIRISDDENYIRKVEELITTKNRKGKKTRYYRR
jgi:hypothetical protein